MALKNVLPLNPVVNIIVNLSTISAPRKAFDMACLIGESSDIKDFKTARVVTYDGVNAMLEAGFKPDSRLIEAATLIFGQSKTPKNVMIGMRKKSKFAGKATYTVKKNAVAGDTVAIAGLTLTAGSATGGFVVGVSTTGTAANLALALSKDSTVRNKYIIEVKGSTITLTERTAAGGNTPDAAVCTGTIEIESQQVTTSEERMETPLEAYQACRQADGEWYIGMMCMNLTNDDILAIATFNESTQPDTIFAFTTSDAAVTEKSDGGIFSQLQLLSVRRTIGQYSSVHSDAIAAIVGWAMGAMTGTTNSAYTLAYKTEVGVKAENAVKTFTTNQVNALKAFNGNVYINRGTYYNVFEEGKMFDGSWFDEIIYLDKFKNDCQLAIMDLLVSNNKLPQTEAGMTRIKDAIKTECDGIYRIGFIAEGVWKGAPLLGLAHGDALPQGYIIQSDSIDAQSQADRDARKAPPIYVSLKLAGAIHHVTIQVDVNR